MEKLTPYEQSVIAEFIYCESEARAAMREVESSRKEMLKVLGHKADCPHCRNRHWPICDVYS